MCKIVGLLEGFLLGSNYRSADWPLHWRPLSVFKERTEHGRVLDVFVVQTVILGITATNTLNTAR